MKIADAKKAYGAQLDALRNERVALKKLLQDSETPGGAALANFDKLEITRRLEEVDSAYEATQETMEGIVAKEVAVHNAEAARQQGEVMAEAAQEMGKTMVIYRRIADGGKVPMEDERKLMDYSHEMYMAAKTAALIKQGQGEEYESLWQEERPMEEGMRPSEIAAETEIDVAAPKDVAAQARTAAAVDAAADASAGAGSTGAGTAPTFSARG